MNRCTDAIELLLQFDTHFGEITGIDAHTSKFHIGKYLHEWQFDLAV